MVAIDTPLHLQQLRAIDNGTRIERISTQRGKLMTIPVVVISKEDGDSLLMFVKSNPNVEVTINLIGQRTISISL